MSQPLLVAWALLIAVVVPSASSAQPPRPPRDRRPPPPVIEGIEAVDVAVQRGEIDLTGKIYVLEDPSAGLGYNDVRQPEMADRFRLVDPDDLNYGFSDAAIWLRLDLRASRPAPPDWMLVFDYPLLDRVEVYDASARTDEPIRVLGDRRPFAERAFHNRLIGMPVRLGRPPAALRYYIRVTSQSSLQLRLRLVDGASLFEVASRGEFLYGIGYGVVFLLALYNLILFFAVRDWAYLAYFFVLVCGGLFSMALNGHLLQYLLPDQPGLANLASPLLAALWILSTACFGRIFLAPGKFEPRLRPVLDSMIVLGVIATVVALVADYRFAMRFASFAAALHALALLTSGIVAWRGGHKASRYFIIAWLGLVAGVVTLAASRFGWLPDNDWTRNGAMVGAVFEAMLLSLALSDRFHIVQAELERHSRQLEGKVDERTRELAEANRRLERLSRVDGLTGIANRRSFDETLDSETRRCRRSGEPLSLLLVDADRFKQFNDRWGHQAGDEALRRIAAEISTISRRASDLAARYGGEEFAVILAGAAAAEAEELAGTIRAAVAALEIPVGENEAASLTVSVGVATAYGPDAAGFETLLPRADRALYRAKVEGRDRVCAEAARSGSSPVGSPDGRLPSEPASRG